MSEKFDMILVVPTKLVGPILELVSNEGIVVRVNPHNQEKIRKSGYRDGIKDKGIKGADLLIQCLEKVPSHRATLDDLRKAFVEKGFSKNSIDATVSQAVKNGKVKRDGKFVVLK